MLIADKAVFKRQMTAVFEDDLFREEPTRIVNEAVARLGEHYKIQANPRPINLFYLKGDLRNRIERTAEGFAVVDSTIKFSEEELREELRRYRSGLVPM